MMKVRYYFILIFSLCYCCFTLVADDIRNIEYPYGVIPHDNYCDQAYVVVAHNGDWVSVMTTGPSTEQGIKYVVSSISKDAGKTWTSMQELESSHIPASTWAIPYCTSYGRIYVIYCYQREFVFRYSDDNGESWSKDRYPILVPLTTVDFINDLGNGCKYMWSVAKPLLIKGDVCFSFTKYALKTMEIGEGFILKSSNIDHEYNPQNLDWIMLPEGDTGIVNPVLGSVQEEHTLVTLANGTIYTAFRTKQGYIGCSYSRDKGNTWSLPTYVTYADGRPIKHPRACPRLFKCHNGNFLLWIHNTNKVLWWNYRNPAWIVGGIERNGQIEWSQPEILLYSTDTITKMSYPDLIEDNGKYYFTETQKTMCRVHEINNKLIENLWHETERNDKIIDGIIFEQNNITNPINAKISLLPNLGLGAFSLDMWIETPELIENEVIIRNCDGEGNGVTVSIASNKTVKLNLKQGEENFSWTTDPATVKKGVPQHIVFVVDGAPNIVTVIVNGKFNDGAHYRYFGWSWFSWKFHQLSTSHHLELAPSFTGKIDNIRIYNHHLTTNEAISNFRFGCENFK